MNEFQLGSWGYKWPHVDVHMAEFSAYFLEHRVAALLVG